jgi:hypothetical protein
MAQHEAQLRRDVNHTISTQLVAHAKDPQAVLVLED